MSAHSIIKGNNFSCKSKEHRGSWILFSECYETARQNLLEECCRLVCSAFRESDKIGDPSAPNPNLYPFSIQSRAGVDSCNTVR